MKIIDADIVSVKSMGRRILGFRAAYKDLDNIARRKATKAEAVAVLQKQIEFRCTFESSRVKFVTVREHLLILSYDLYGYVVYHHRWPEDGHISLTTGYESFEAAETSFRMHVAQTTWDGGAYKPSDILAANQQDDFKSWVGFQLAYKTAKANGMTSPEAHQWASNNTAAFVSPKVLPELLSNFLGQAAGAAEMEIQGARSGRAFGQSNVTEVEKGWTK